jgi:hypothetical protein
MLMWVQFLCSDTMRAHDHHRTEPSIAGSLAFAALFAALPVAVSFPVQFAALVVVLGASAVLARTVWRQVTTRGLALPGAAGRVCVQRGAQEGTDTRWALTVAVVED